MAKKDKVKAHVRRTKKGVARVTGHARKNKKKLAIGAGAVLGVGTIVGGAVALKKGAGKNLLKKHGKKVSTAMTNTSQTVASKTSTVMDNTAQTVTSKASEIPKLTQEQFNKAQKAAMSGGVKLDTMDIRSSPGVGLTQAQRGVAMVPVNKPTMANKSTTTKVAGAVGGVAGRTYGAGKATRKAFAEGYANPGTGAAYQVGRNIAGGVKNTVSTIDALVKRAAKKRGK